MSADPPLPIQSHAEQDEGAKVLSFLPAAVGLTPAEYAYAKLDFESWLALCNVSTWLDLAESQSEASARRHSA